MKSKTLNEANWKNMPSSLQSDKPGADERQSRVFEQEVAVTDAPLEPN